MREGKPKGRGRPRKLTEKDFETIKELASSGLTLPECASLMQVSRTAVESLLKTLDSQDLKAVVHSLQLRPQALSKIIVAREIEGGNLDVAKWFLDRVIRLESERSRIALQRAQLKVLQPEKENLPDALPSVYWEKVNRYFSSQYQDKPEPTEADPGDNNKGGDN